jgi:integrase
MPIIEDYFQELLRKNRPGICNETIDSYLGCLRNIARGIDIHLETENDLITHYDKIMEYLMTMKPSGRKTKISAIVVTTDHIDTDEGQDIVTEYRAQMTKDAHEVHKQEKKQVFSKKKEDNYIRWSEVMEIYKNLEEEVKPLWKMTLNKTQFFRLQDYVILSCYVLIAPRRSKDFCQFKIRKVDEEIGNYMLVPKKKKKASSFVFNQYKNGKRLGTEIVPIPLVLKRIIDKWIAKNPYDWLFLNTQYHKMNASRMTILLNRIFEKKISTTMLRNIYLTSKFDHVDLEDLEDTAYKMGNNQITRILKYVKKKVKEE